MKKRNNKKKQSSLSRILASSEKKHVIHDLFFKNLSGGEINNSIRHIAHHRHFRSAIDLSGTGYENFYERKTPKAPIDKNIGWCLGLLEYHAEKIQFFLNVEQEIIWLLLNDDAWRIIKLLDEIDSVCGYSMWSIGLRGSILGMLGMMEEKRNFLTEISTENQGNSFFRALASLVANKYEDGNLVTPESGFLEQKVRRSFAGETLHFLMYKVVPTNFEFEYDFSHILNIEKNSSPIDIFKCLFDIVTYSVYAANDIYSSEARVMIRNMNRLFSSPSLSGLANFYGERTEWNFNDVEYELLDLYTSGNYSKVCDIIEGDLSLCRKFALFELWARSNCRVQRNTTGFIGEILKSTTSMMLKDADFERSIVALSMHCHCFGILPWFKELQYLIVRETRFLSAERNQRLYLASISLSEVASPLKRNCIPEPLCSEYAEKIRIFKPNSVVVKLYENITPHSPSDWYVSGVTGMDKLRAKKYFAQSLISQERYYEAIRLLEKLRESTDMLVVNDATRILISTYIEMGKLEEAIEMYVKAVMDNSFLLRTFDNKSIAVACENLTHSSKSISVPISLSFYSHFVDDSFDPALKYSFERFLTNNGVESPLELFSSLAFDKNQLLYFFEHVCVPKNMRLYLFFSSPNEIEECRIEICKKLIEQKHSVDTLISEVKDRTRRLVIQNATKHVENSRIYSDTNNFMMSSDYRLIFDSFIELQTNDYSSEADEKILKDIFDKSKLKNETHLINRSYTIHIQNIILNEKNSIFLKLCKIARDEFTFGVKGLSGHLSTRIRHGHFPNAVRKCVSENHLISPKQAVSAGYKRNIIWVEKFSNLSPFALNSISKIFAEFSTKYDALIKEVNDGWFQINVIDQDMSGLDQGELNDLALFNYSTTAFEAYCIQKRLPINADYSDFVKTIIQWLWDRTEINLEKIRKKISSDFRERAFKLLDSLETEMFKVIGPGEDMTEFSESIVQSRMRLTSAVDVFIGWFTRSQGLTVPMFDSDIAVTIARLSAGADVNHQDVSGIQFQGRTLCYFVDVLYVLLENCVTKSNLSREDLKIDTKLERNKQFTVLSVTNNCKVKENLELENKKLQCYRDPYGKEEFTLKAAQGEGGTGFFKVWKSLAKDLELQHQIIFGYEAVDRFNVSITIDNNEFEKVRYHESPDN